MESNETEANNSFEDDCDDDDGQNSDIESRLYAEIYYSNNAYEENNTNDGETNKETAAGSNRETNEATAYNTTKSGENITQPVQVSHHKSNDPKISTENTLKNNKIVAESTEGTSNALNISLNKRQLENKNCSTSEKSKRTKNDNQDSGAVREQKSKSKSVDSVSSDAIVNSSPLQNNINQILNPYNKQVVNNVETGLKLLSPEFLNLFFPNRKSKRKDKSILKKKKRVARISTPTEGQLTVAQNLPSGSSLAKNVAEQSVTTEISSDVEKEEKKTNLPNADTIIDISSDDESSDDSIDDISSKFKAVKSTAEKLKSKELKSKNVHSDSEESIFEVPIPPKPLPPVIELRDSDAGNDSESNSNSDEDSFLNDSSVSNLNITRSDSIIALDTSSEINNIVSDDEESNNITLNCTEVQKGASTLDEIRRFNSLEANTEKENRNTNVDDCTTRNTQNLEETDNTVEETVSTSEKVANTLKDRHKKVHIDRRNLSLAEYFFEPMNDRMKAFYNDSWGGEDFDLARIKSKMSTDPKKWAILNRDLVITGPRRKRYFGMVCSRCQKEGHKPYECPEKFKLPSCNMCGVEGHVSTNCPGTQCLSCGRRQPMYRSVCGSCERTFCNRCKTYGHLDYNCPDLWRRYHNTTNGVDPKAPANQRSVMKSQNRLFCCNCAKQGHDSNDCRKFRWSQHFPNPPHVISYQGPSYTTDGNADSVGTLRNRHERFDRSSPTNDESNRSSSGGFHDENKLSSDLYEQSPSSSGNKGKNEILQNSPANETDSKSEKIIFKIESKITDEIKNLKTCAIKLNVPSEVGSNLFENWKNLYLFLKDFSSSSAIQAALREKSKHFIMDLRCSRKYTAALTKLIKQYASRNSFERTLMFLRFDRNTEVMLELLSRKFAEMNRMRVDPNRNFEEIKKLDANDLKNPRFVIALQELLLVLYKEGFADKSLQLLRKMYNKLKRSNDRSGPSNPKKKRKSAPTSLMTIKNVFQYLYYYNNIFVPYHTSNLAAYMEKYKEHIDRINRLKKNPLLCPPDQNGTQNSTDQAETVDLTNSIEQATPTPKPSLSTPSTSKESLPMSRNTSRTPEKPRNCSANNQFTQPQYLDNIPVSNSENFWEDAYSYESGDGFVIDETNHNSNDRILQKPQSIGEKERKPNHLYISSQLCKSDTKKKRYLKKFQNFIKGTKHVLKQAMDLRAPHMQREITLLQHKLKNEKYLRKADVQPLTKLVQTELERQS